MVTVPFWIQKRDGSLAEGVTTLVFSDGECRRIQHAPGQSVVQAAARSGLRLLVDCREGGCGTCKATCRQGRFVLDDYSTDALTDAERADGYVLACRLLPEGPCVVEFDYPIAQAQSRPAPALRDASVETIRSLARDVVELTLQAQDGKPFHFLAGQYANIEVPGTKALRSYSFCNAPGEARAVFTIRIEPGGVTGQWISRAQPGDALRIGGPFGRFFLRDAARPLLLVAGGTGIAPILSMLRALAADGSQPPRIDLAFGVNDANGLFYQAEIAEALAAFPEAKLHLAAMRTGEGFQGATGSVMAAVAALDLPDDVHAYLCGPPPMIESARAFLGSRGVTERAIFTEAFAPNESAKAA